VTRLNISKIIIFDTTSDEDEFYMKILDLDEIYNFVVLSFFYLKTLKCSKNNIKFQEHNNRGLVLVVLDK